MKHLTDEVIIAEAIRMVECGINVTFPVNGRSMLPFIVGGRESLVLVKPNSVKVGDVVLAFVDNNRYVVHRIEKVEGENLTLMGDGNLAVREYCKVSDVKALATHVIDKDGACRPLYSKGRLALVRLWLWCMPIRRYLLKIYLMTHRI